MVGYVLIYNILSRVGWSQHWDRLISWHLRCTPTWISLIFIGSYGLFVLKCGMWNCWCNAKVLFMDPI